MSDSVSETPAGSAEAPAPARASEADDNLLILTLRNTVLFPQVVLPITIRRERSVAAAQEAVKSQRKVGFCCSGTRTRTIRSSTACIASARSPASCATSPRPMAATT